MTSFTNELSPAFDLAAYETLCIFPADPFEMTESDWEDVFLMYCAKDK